MKENLWDEKNSIGASMKFENNQTNDLNDITKKTNIKYVKHEWRIIDGKKKWLRKCPKCESELTYSHRQSICLANKKNSLCAKCTFSLNEVKEKISRKGEKHWNYGKHLTKETKQKLRERMLGEKNPFYNKKHTSEVINKLKTDPKIKHFGENNGFYKKTHTDLTKEKLAQNAKLHQTGRVKSNLERLNLSIALKGKTKSTEHKRKIGLNSKKQFLIRKEKLGLLKIGYNPVACKYFDELNEQNGWSLQHALNGGEKRVFCYFLDAYDELRNIVVEYDEKHHYDRSGNLRESDIIRMKDIIKKLNCRFYRYNQTTNEFQLLNDGDLHYEKT